MKPFSAILVVALGTLLISAPPAQSTQKSRTSSYSSSEGRKYSFAIVTRDGSVNNWGDGSFDLDSLKSRTKEDTIYVRKDGVLYAITDHATVSGALAAQEPMRKIGKEMGEVGREQGGLSKEQGKIGAQQGDLGRKMGELGRQLGEEVRNGESTTDTSAKMKEIGKEMAALGKEMAEVGQRFGREFGAKMGELGRQMGAAAKEADAKITKLIDDAFTRGLARKV